jgi:short-chain Z-isoprenyl diphosphate synthase
VKTLRTVLLTPYRARLRRVVRAGLIPRHVGLIIDGNRRWARQHGLASASLGHRAGAEHVEDLLSWCRALGIQHVTVFVCSTENLQRRKAEEVAFLMRLVEHVVTDRLARPDGQWRVHVAGALDIVPTTTALALKRAVETTRTVRDAHVTLAIGYGGRQEVVEAVRELCATESAAGRTTAELASSLTLDDITRHLWTARSPEPELVIRTSGEQRLSNFLLWQGVRAELFFCDAYWPAFREVDFLRALRGYSRRVGGRA